MVTTTNTRVMLGNNRGHTLKEKNNSWLETGNRLQSPVSVCRSGNSSIHPDRKQHCHTVWHDSCCISWKERVTITQFFISYHNQQTCLMSRVTSFPGKDVGSTLTFLHGGVFMKVFWLFSHVCLWERAGDTLSAWRRVFVTLKSSIHQFTHSAELYCQCLPTVWNHNDACRGSVSWRRRVALVM